jgi:hypothetical protein
MSEVRFEMADCLSANPPYGLNGELGSLSSAGHFIA